MSFYLVQHGKSLSKDQDPEQGLSEEGVLKVTMIADVAKGYSVKVSEIRHSVKKRARQTAEIFAKALNPEKGIIEITGIKPLDDVALIAKTLKVEDNLMLVGHLPFMERMVSFLITGKTEPVVFKFQNGGIVCLDQNRDAGNWFIKWALMPEIG